jgi:deoxyribonuclease-4
MLFGAHMSIGGGVWRALERGRLLGCEVVQLFVKNNRRWFGRPLAREELARYQNERAAGRFAAVFGHAGYLINLAAPPSPNRDKSVRSLIEEVHRATALGLPFLVVHPGAHLDQGAALGLKQVAAALTEVLAATRTSPVRLALENTAGQGTCLGGPLAHLAAIYERVGNSERLGVCLDTAHLFAAGYDLRTPAGWDAVIREVDALLGLQEVLAFHLNDSQAPLGSRRDRHAHIGRGRIGLAAFGHVVRDARFARHPGCLETPKAQGLRADARNLRTLRALAKGHQAGP